jgi:hypothetical protein
MKKVTYMFSNLALVDIKINPKAKRAFRKIK